MSESSIDNMAGIDLALGVSQLVGRVGRYFGHSLYNGLLRAVNCEISAVVAWADLITPLAMNKQVQYREAPRPLLRHCKAKHAAQPQKTRQRHQGSHYRT